MGASSPGSRSQNGVTVTGLTAGAGSFGEYGSGLQSTPHVGDAIVFGYNGNGYAQHVGIVTAVGSGTVTVIGGNEDGVSGNWAATSSVKQYTFNSAVGYDWYGETISGYVSPVGGTGTGGTATPHHVYDNQRNTDGTWTGAALADGGGTVTRVALSAMSNGDMHLFTLAGGKVYDNIRYASGAWKGASLVDGGGNVTSITAATTTDGILHLETLGANGDVYGNNMSTAGSWSGASLVDGAGTITAISDAALTDGTMHLETLAGGKAYDNQLNTNGIWTGAAVSDGGGNVHDIAIAGLPDGTMHLETLA